MTDVVPTVLELVNNALSDMGREEVNALNATPEAKRVLQIVKDTYYHIVTRKKATHKTRHIPLDSAADSTKPTKLIFTSEFDSLKELRYNVADAGEDDQYELMTYLYPEDFLQMCYQRSSSDTDTTYVTNEDGVKFLVYSDRAPTYWTSFDEEHIYLDSYKSTVESTLQGSKSVAHVLEIPTFPSDASASPELPARYFPMFKSMIKVACYEKIKQMANQTDSQWGGAAYAGLRHEDGSRTGQDRPRKKTYGKRALGRLIVPRD